MKYRRIAASALVPPLLLGASLPAWALLGGLEGVSTQVEQWVQIAEQGVEILETVEGFQNQLDEMRNKAMGRIGALTEPFEQLAARPAALFESAAVDWLEDFEGPPRELADTLADLGQSGRTLTEHWRDARLDADAMTEEDVLRAFRNEPTLAERAAETWRSNRQAADSARVADYAAFDAAEELLEMLTDAQEAVAGLRGQTELADTALQQAALAGQLTDTEINVALAQLMAHSIVRDAHARRQAEIERLRENAQWLEARADFEARIDAMQRATRARRDDYAKSMLLPERHGE